MNIVKQSRREAIIKSGKTLFLFDIDGTLTPPRQTIRDNMIEYLTKLGLQYDIAAVGGSDLNKLKEQLGNCNILFYLAINLFKYVFSENGLVGVKSGEIFHTKRINEYLGEEKLKSFINYCLRYIADLDIPIKRGTFIEYRTGLINVSPIGRNCSQEERTEFNLYNKEYKILENFKSTLEKEFSEYQLKISIGGQISFDCFPIGWDKTYCLQFLEHYDNIFFFGDKTHEGGNDYEIAIDAGITKSFSVSSPEDTVETLTYLIENEL